MQQTVQKPTTLLSNGLPVAQYAREIDGYLFDEEGPFLMSLAQQCTGQGVIVEIGSYCGKSTVWLATGSQCGAGVTVYAIDHHEGSPEHQVDTTFHGTEKRFRDTIRGAGLDGIVTAVVTTSEAAASTWTQPIELLFIDGAHDYHSVRGDFERWSPFVIPGGTIAFHDSSGYWPGVWRVIQESVLRGAQYSHFRFCRTLTAAQKGSSRRAMTTVRDWHRICARRLEVWQHTRRSLRVWRSPKSK
jgi:predicted O-methyltransferase YrrM